MFQAHSREVGGAFGKPRFDEAYLLRLEEAGAVASTLAFRKTTLVGYLLWYLGDTTLEYAGLRHACQGPWYLEPGARGHGLGEAMMRWSLKSLRDQGYEVAFPHRWERSPEALDAMFASLGAQPLERTWWLDLRRKGD